MLYMLQLLGPYAHYILIGPPFVLSLGFPDCIFVANGSNAPPGLVEMLKKSGTKPGNCITEYAGSACLRERTPLSDSLFPKKKTSRRCIMLQQQSGKCFLTPLEANQMNRAPRTTQLRFLLSSPATRPALLHQSSRHPTTQHM